VSLLSKNKLKEEQLFSATIWHVTVQIFFSEGAGNAGFGICFTGETLVKTEDGDKQIKGIQVGDKVYSENAETGEKGYRSVKQVFVNEAYTLLHITVKDTVIKTTFPHPFYVVGKEWVEAKDLLVGDVMKLANGETTEVKALEVEELENPVKVYNFEVEDWHTYYVSEYGVLVHNKGSNPCAQPGSYSNTHEKGNYQLVGIKM